MNINETHAEEIGDKGLSFSLDSDSIWTLVWIVFLSSVIVVIIVVVMKACILLFKRTDDVDFEDSKDSPNILRMAVAGPNNFHRESPTAPEVPVMMLECERPVSPGSVKLSRPSPKSTRPCCRHTYADGVDRQNNKARLPNSAESGAVTYAYKNPFGGLDSQAAVAGFCYLNMIR